MRYGADIYALRIGNVIEPHEYPMFKGFLDKPMTRKRNAWSYIDARDLGQIVHLCIEKDGLGFQVFNAVNDTITTREPTAEFLKKYVPADSAEARDGGQRGPALQRQDPRGARLQGRARLAEIRLMPLPFTPLVETLPSSVPFVGPEALERRTGTRFRARIGANESVFGPSPKVDRRHAAGGGGDAGNTATPRTTRSRRRSRRHLGVAPENVMVGEGIDGLFGLPCGSSSSRASRSPPRSAPIPPSTSMSMASAAGSSPRPM